MGGGAGCTSRGPGNCQAPRVRGMEGESKDLQARDHYRTGGGGGGAASTALITCGASPGAMQYGDGNGETCRRGAVKENCDVVTVGMDDWEHRGGVQLYGGGGKLENTDHIIFFQT